MIPRKFLTRVWFYFACVCGFGSGMLSGHVVLAVRQAADVGATMEERVGIVLVGALSAVLMMGVVYSYLKFREAKMKEDEQ